MPVQAPDRQRKVYGTVAMLVWLASGLFLFSVTEGADFYSQKAALFFLVGLWLADVVVGGLCALVLVTLADVLEAALKEGTARARAILARVGQALFFVETVAVFLAARWLMARLFPA